MTTMSSKRTFEPAMHAEKSRSGIISAFAFVGGILLAVLGAKVDAPIILGIGFVAFMSAFMYWNAMFWGWMTRNQKNDFSRRDYPYI